MSTAVGSGENPAEGAMDPMSSAAVMAAGDTAEEAADAAGSAADGDVAAGAAAETIAGAAADARSI